MRPVAKPWGNGNSFAEPEADAINRKATIVIDHLIQASDVSHTMQHWHVYIKWYVTIREINQQGPNRAHPLPSHFRFLSSFLLNRNERLFHEMHGAYLAGRAEKSPAVGWYEGELGFFDFYIIPLAKKLSECGVFGVSSDEYLSYALQNRAKWERKGEGIVDQYMAKYTQGQKDFYGGDPGKRNGQIIFLR